MRLRPGVGCRGACCTAQHRLSVVQQDCPGLAQKAAIRTPIAVKRLQKLEQARGIVGKLLACERKEKW